MPQLFGDVAPESFISPFSHREAFEKMLRLRTQFRVDQRPPIHVLQHRRPDILELPFNRYTGLRLVVDVAVGPIRCFLGEHPRLRRTLGH